MGLPAESVTTAVALTCGGSKVDGTSVAASVNVNRAGGPATTLTGKLWLTSEGKVLDDAEI